MDAGDDACSMIGSAIVRMFVMPFYGVLGLPMILTGHPAIFTDTASAPHLGCLFPACYREVASAKHDGDDGTAATTGGFFSASSASEGDELSDDSESDDAADDEQVGTGGGGSVVVALPIEDAAPLAVGGAVRRPSPRGTGAMRGHRYY